jgi:hypothetical protein
MSSVQLYITKEKNDKLQLWVDASDDLKRAVIKSLGESVREIITIKTSRFQQITVAEIIERVRARFGKLQKDTKAVLKLRMTSMLKVVSYLDKHIATLTKIFTISETAGSVVDEDNKVDYFRDSLFHRLRVKSYALTRRNTVMRCAEPRTQITLLGGSKKVNDQDPSRPRKGDANLMDQADDDNDSEYNDSNQYDDEWHTDDSLVFFSRFEYNDPDRSPDFPPPTSNGAPTRATAFMMDDMSTILKDDDYTPHPAMWPLLYVKTELTKFTRAYMGPRLHRLKTHSTTNRMSRVNETTPTFVMSPVPQSLG